MRNGPLSIQIKIFVWGAPANKYPPKSPHKLGLIVAKNADFRIFAGVNPFFDYVIAIFKQWTAIIYILKLSGHA